jgi:hypothetical protein
MNATKSAADADKKSVLPMVTVLTGIFLFTVICDVLITYFAIGKGYSEANPLTALLLDIDPILWVIVRLFGAGVVCFILIKLATYKNTITKTGSLVISTIICSIGSIQAIQNFKVMGVL